MKEFTIMTHPALPAQAVKEGFSFPGFFFAVFWAIYKQMWSVAGITFGGITVLFIVLMFIFGDTLSEEDFNVITNIISLIVSIVFGIMGNKWYKQNLVTKGYEEVDIVQAATPEGAVALYMKNNN
jgi:uncharacterized membrane protein